VSRAKAPEPRWAEIEVLTHLDRMEQLPEHLIDAAEWPKIRAWIRAYTRREASMAARLFADAETIRLDALFTARRRR
jgi:hypothetical protein